ncbi:MAG TPA: ATP-binding protein, partial [Ilumatobacteraceae bacterium]|nr:ATP-binding protein [Ilumatobacteraceae bacterium]
MNTVAARESPFMVGRRQDVEEIMDTLHTIERESRPITVLVSGEAGIGKSRMLHAVELFARDRGFAVLRGACVNLGEQILPAAAVRDIVVELFDAAGDQLIEEAVGGGREALARLLPGHAVSDASDTATSVPELVVAAVRALARRGPVVVMFDDLHWADATTRELFSRLAKARWLGPVAIVGSLRSDELHRGHALLPMLEDVVRAVRPV